MAARLGNVLYWAAIAIAALWLWLAVSIHLISLTEVADLQSTVFVFGIAVGIALVGVAAKYVLSGK